MRVSGIVDGMARVDLWISSEAEVTPALLDAYRAWLSPEEERRAQRFVREEDRRAACPGGESR